MSAIEDIFADIVSQTLTAITSQVVIGVDAQDNLQVSWPTLPDLIQHVAARVDLSALGGLPAGGITVGQLIDALAEQERVDAMAVIMQDAALMAILVRALASQSTVQPGSSDTSAIIHALGPDGYAVLTSQRIGELLQSLGIATLPPVGDAG